MDGARGAMRGTIPAGLPADQAGEEGVQEAALMGAQAAGGGPYEFHQPRGQRSAAAMSGLTAQVSDHTEAQRALGGQLQQQLGAGGWGKLTGGLLPSRLQHPSARSALQPMPPAGVGVRRPPHRLHRFDAQQCRCASVGCALNSRNSHLSGCPPSSVQAPGDPNSAASFLAKLQSSGDAAGTQPGSRAWPGGALQGAAPPPPRHRCGGVV